MKIYRYAMLLLVMLAASSCGVPQSPDAFNATPEAVFLRQIVKQLAARDIAAVEAELDTSLMKPDTHDLLVTTANLLPNEAATSVTPVSWRFFTMNGNRKATVAAEYQFPSKRMLVSAIFVGDAAHLKIAAFHFTRLAAPLSVTNAFTFADKPIASYMFLGAELLALGISIFAIVQCLRTRDLRRKWLWIVLMLVGVCQFTLNWTTGTIDVQLLRFDILSAGYAREGWVGPWMLSVCIPVGAIVFLLKHRRPSA
ncbi:MAG: hypothetical protein ABI183_05670 [Polyangiaceae bacterium]